MKTQEKPKYSIGQNLAFMLKTAWHSRKRVPVTAAAIAAVTTALNLVQLYAAPEILAKVESGAPIAQLLTTIGGFTAALFLLTGLEKYLDRARLCAEVDVRGEIIRLLTRKHCETSYPNTLDTERARLKNQTIEITSGNDEASEHIWTTLTQLISAIACFVIYLLLLSSLHPLLMLVILVTSCIGFFVSRHINQWEYRHRDEKEGIEKELSYYQQCAKSLELAKDIRIFGLASWLRELQSKSMGAFNAFLLRREKAYIWANLADVLMALLRNGVAYAYLLRLTLNHGLTASEFLLFFTAVSGFTGHVTGILTQFSTLHKESLDLSKVQEYLNLPEPFLFEGGAEPPAAEAYELRLEDVSFRYPGSDRDILRHLDLTIHPGEKLAVVGLNGAGKTTLVMLLCGFYDPTQGRVLLNGRDIREFDRSRYYRLFSAVFQEFSILDTTIAQCVAQQFDGIDMDRVSDCIEKAGLAEAVARLPQGLGTHLGREVFLDGVMLSGGQTQRLMLARALYKDGPILVLDEPTAALDPLAEHDIYMKYDQMTAGKTSVFISHRLASTRFCHRIVFMADGGIAEEGTHQELLEKNGAYAQLFEVQSRYYQEGGADNEEER